MEALHVNSHLPPQKQPRQPGIETRMRPLPESELDQHIGTSKLQNKVAVITGGDSGIGRAVAIAFAKEGADIVIMYLNEHQDAERTQQDIKALGRSCLLLAGDVGIELFCIESIATVLEHYGGIDILVNNATEQHTQSDITAITEEQLVKTFRSNVFSMFFLAGPESSYMSGQVLPPNAGEIING